MLNYFVRPMYPAHITRSHIANHPAYHHNTALQYIRASHAFVYPFAIPNTDPPGRYTWSLNLNAIPISQHKPDHPWLLYPVAILDHHINSDSDTSACSSPKHTFRISKHLFRDFWIRPRYSCSSLFGSAAHLPSPANILFSTVHRHAW